jgi:hypothetical protein
MTKDEAIIAVAGDRPKTAIISDMIGLLHGSATHRQQTAQSRPRTPRRQACGRRRAGKGENGQGHEGCYRLGAIPIGTVSLNFRADNASGGIDRTGQAVGHPQCFKACSPRRVYTVRPTGAKTHRARGGDPTDVQAPNTRPAARVAAALRVVKILAWPYLLQLPCEFCDRLLLHNQTGRSKAWRTEGSADAPGYLSIAGNDDLVIDAKAGAAFVSVV